MGTVIRDKFNNLTNWTLTQTGGSVSVSSNQCTVHQSDTNTGTFNRIGACNNTAVNITGGGGYTTYWQFKAPTSLTPYQFYFTLSRNGTVITNNFNTGVSLSIQSAENVTEWDPGASSNIGSFTLTSGTWYDCKLQATIPNGVNGTFDLAIKPSANVGDVRTSIQSGVFTFIGETITTTLQGHNSNFCFQIETNNPNADIILDEYYQSDSNGSLNPDITDVAGICIDKVVHVSWTAAVRGNTILSYNVYRDGIFLANSATNSYLDSAVNAGDTHFYSVAVKNNTSTQEVTELHNSANVFVYGPMTITGANSFVGNQTTLFQMTTAVTDPMALSLTFAWTKLTGPGNVTFSSASIVNPIVAVNQPGTYTINLAATDPGQTKNFVVTLNITSLGLIYDSSTFYTNEGFTDFINDPKAVTTINNFQKWMTGSGILIDKLGFLRLNPTTSVHSMIFQIDIMIPLNVTQIIALAGIGKDGFLHDTHTTSVLFNTFLSGQQIRFNDYGENQVSGGTPIATYQTGVWYTLKFQINGITGTSQAFINGPGLINQSLGTSAIANDLYNVPLFFSTNQTFITPSTASTIWDNFFVHTNGLNWTPPQRKEHNFENQGYSLKELYP